MEKHILAAFFVLSFLQMSAQDNSTKKDSLIIVLADSFCVSNSAPIPYKYGTIIKINCDTAYVINKMRLDKYEAARNFILNSNNKTTKALIDKYEATLDEQDKYYKQLMKSYIQSDSVSQNLIKDARGDLLGVSNNLKTVSGSIDSVNTKLNEVQTLIKKQKWESLKQKLMVGFGGLGAGILIGILVSL